ncbi:MAG: adenylyltransferase, partial [Planctomycetota bacterium]|nr:adenylyltransferase [Planctomycetota bacterium]
MGTFKEPHGGELKNLYLSADEAEREKKNALEYKSWDLTERQICDLELLLNGAFSPLDGFLKQADYEGVLKDMRLACGVLWPMPITLDVTDNFASTLDIGESIALRDREGIHIATLKVEEKWMPDKTVEAQAVFGTMDDTHPGINYLFNYAHPVYVGGGLAGIKHPVHYDFKHLRDSPQELRNRFEKLGWRKVVAFQTRNPMHRA